MEMEAYVQGRQLGEGVDGVVRMVSHVPTGQEFACKSVPKDNPEAARHARSEISHLAKLGDHPHIVRLHHHFEDDAALHMVLEPCLGGDLFSRLQRAPGGRLAEREAAQAAGALMKALCYCHQRGIAHLDVKLENVLLPRAQSPLSHAKLADFGASADFSRRRFLSEVEGTPHYIAPEVLAGSYDEKADAWSLGVLLYVLLAGYPPFDGETAEEIFAAVRRRPLDVKREPWGAISAEAKDVVKGLLQRNPYRRLKLTQLAVHPWLLQHIHTGNANPNPEPPSSASASATLESSSSLQVNG